MNPSRTASEPVSTAGQPHAPLPPAAQQPQTLRACVTSVLEEYLGQVDPELVSDLYAMVMSEVEAPLFAAVLRKARSNQSRAAQMLGLNRGTLRKKLKQYDLLE
jgi:Fis family transcriptional regulator, factor for inversion stimulation protein